MRRRSFGLNVAVYSGASALVAVLSLVNVIVTSRLLGPEGRGAIAFLTTIAMLGSQLSSLGVEEAAGNIAGREPEQRPALATNALIFAASLGALMGVAILALTVLAPGTAAESSLELRVAAVAAIPLLVFQYYLGFLVRADYGFAVTNATSLIAPVFNLGANGTLALTGTLSVKTAVAAWIVGQLLSTTILAWYVARRLAGFGRPNLRLGRSMLTFGLQAHAGRVMKAGNYRLDQWILGALAGQRELGLYSVAVAWSEGMFLLPEALAAIIRPDVVRSGHDEAGSRTAAAFRIGILATVPAMLIVILAAPILCVSVFGADFADSIGELRVLACGALGIVAMKILANSLVAQGRPMLSSLAIGLAFVTTIAFDVTLIPSFGGLGAAAASTIAYTTGGIAVAIIFARTTGVRLRDLIPRGRGTWGSTWSFAKR
jgi:O-antigen/teichoic acid export membrane protein